MFVKVVNEGETVLNIVLYISVSTITIIIIIYIVIPGLVSIWQIIIIIINNNFISQNR